MPVIAAKNARRVKFLPDARLSIKGKAGEAAAGGPGSLEGYLAIYGVVDSDAEVFRAGCFKKSMEQKVAAGKVPLMSKHFRDGGDAGECIGTITTATDDNVGMKIEAVFSSDPEAQNIRIRIAEKHIKGLSVGFVPRSYEERQPVNDAEKAACVAAGKNSIIEWVECELLEGTTTVRPTNDVAEITGAKSEHECPHCKGKPVSAVAPSTATGAPPVPTGTAPAATAATTRHGKAQRDRRLKLLGVE